MHANQDLINFAINRLRDGRTPGQVKREIHRANQGWHGFEISSAIAAAIKETAVAAEVTETASKEIVQIPEVDPATKAPAFQNISIDWPLLDVTNAWGLLTAAAVILIILTALVAVYLSL